MLEALCKTLAGSWVQSAGSGVGSDHDQEEDWHRVLSWGSRTSLKAQAQLAAVGALALPPPQKLIHQSKPNLPIFNY